MIVLLLGGGGRPEGMLGTSPINNTGYHLYLTFFIFLVILTLVSVKYAQIIVPASILMVVILEIVGIISYYRLLILGLLISMPAALLTRGLLNVIADFGGFMAEHMNLITSLMLFYFPIFSFYLLLLVYGKVESPKKSMMKGFLLAPLVFLMTLLIIQEHLGSRAILFVFAMISLFYISIIVLPIAIFDLVLDKISDKRIKRWFYIAFFVPIIGPILFLIVFRNTEIETIDDAEPEGNDSE